MLSLQSGQPDVRLPQSNFKLNSLLHTAEETNIFLGQCELKTECSEDGASFVSWDGVLSAIGDADPDIILVKEQTENFTNSYSQDFRKSPVKTFLQKFVYSSVSSCNSSRS